MSLEEEILAKIKPHLKDITNGTLVIDFNNSKVVHVAMTKHERFKDGTRPNSFDMASQDSKS